jgi:hypothetical protein
VFEAVDQLRSLRLIAYDLLSRVVSPHDMIDGILEFDPQSPWHGGRFQKHLLFDSRLDRDVPWQRFRVSPTKARQMAYARRSLCPLEPRGVSRLLGLLRKTGNWVRPREGPCQAMHALVGATVADMKGPIIQAQRLEIPRPTLNILIATAFSCWESGTG